MTDTLVPIKGYFKVDRIIDGEVIDTYEDNNTVMARIPQLFAGLSAGYFVDHVKQYVIGSFAIGTGGSYTDIYGEEAAKEVKNDRTMLFSEHDFWNTPLQISEGQTPIDDEKKRVYQVSFFTEQRGDIGKNVSFLTPVDVSDEGTTFPHTDWTPDSYRGPAASVPEDGITAKLSQQGNMLQYEIIVGQFAANSGEPNDRAIGYNEAGLYFKYSKDIYGTGQPLGALFSMKTFPPQWKNSTCSLRISWKLYF